jgi:hypothetical protein
MFVLATFDVVFYILEKFLGHTSKTNYLKTFIICSIWKGMNFVILVNIFRLNFYVKGKVWGFAVCPKEKSIESLMDVCLVLANRYNEYRFQYHLKSCFTFDNPFI